MTSIKGALEKDCGDWDGRRLNELSSDVWSAVEHIRMISTGNLR